VTGGTAGGVTGDGVGGLYVIVDLGGWPEGLGTTFFGFFFSLPRASRLPINCSSSRFDAICCDAVLWYPVFAAIRNFFVKSSDSRAAVAVKMHLPFYTGHLYEHRPISMSTMGSRHGPAESAQISAVGTLPDA